MKVGRTGQVPTRVVTIMIKLAVWWGDDHDLPVL